MKNSGLFSILGLLVSITLFLSCSAEDGEDGAIGPQGEQGVQGEQGPQGEPGNSNVIASEWFGIDTWDTDTPQRKVYKIPNLEFTDSQLDTGVILVYVRYQFGADILYIHTLPHIVHNTISGALVRRTQSDIFFNELYIQILGFNGFDILNREYLPPATQFRYIIIETQSTTGKNTIPNLSKMSYQEVVDYLGINP